MNNRPRLAIACIAVLGILETASLTLAEFGGKAAELCPTNGCKEVLSSPYAQIFGLPLTLFGFFAYFAVAVIAIFPWLIKGRHWEKQSWLWLLAITTCMAVSSGYLMYVMFFKIQALCPYCLASALFSLSLFLLTVMGHRWSNWRQLTLISVITAMINLTGVVSVYANVNNSVAQTPEAPSATTVGKAPAVTTESGPAEIALAEHLTAINGRVYTAYTCPHCYEQKQLLGKEAVKLLNDVECHPQGENAKPQLCEAAGIRGVPTWEINGELYPGVQSLEKLADLSGYTGSREFINPFPY